MRGPLLVLTWIVATVLATGLAWAGVRSVVDDVAAPLPVPAATTGQAAPSEGPPANESDDPFAEPSPNTSEPESSPEETVRTFELYGGTATVSFSPAGIEVLSAVPKAGFSADVEPENAGMRVEFESDDHRSRLDVWWYGEPRHEIEERNDDGGGDDDQNDGDDDGDDDGDGPGT